MEKKDKNMARKSFYTRDKQEVKVITDQLEEGLKELFAKEKYKSYLSMMSKMHNYSANNIQLITMQCPDATFVAGRKAWENEYNRQIKGREEGIRILDIAGDGTVPEERKRALELLEKMVEYKPLAKVEEMEEQNYNMVDNVLNNGSGEKAQKEGNKKAQDKPDEKLSLKARLAEKKAQAAGQGHEENKKNKQREM